MHGDCSQVRRIILNDRFPLWGYKPDKAALIKIGLTLPSIAILGFGKYNTLNNTWYVLCHSPEFPQVYPSPSLFHVEAIPMSWLTNFAALIRSRKEIINKNAPTTQGKYQVFPDALKNTLAKQRIFDYIRIVRGRVVTSTGLRLPGNTYGFDLSDPKPSKA